MSRLLLLTTLMLTGAAGARAQDARLQRRLDPGTARAVETQLDSARSDRLPTEPLIRKALEGRTKGADSARIVAAVRSLREALMQSRTALGASAGEPELVAGANALRAGLSGGQLAAVRREREGSVRVPLEVMTDLVARGIRPADAALAVERLIRVGRDDGDLVRLRDQIDQDIRTGMAAAAALDRRLSGIPAAGPPRP